MNYSEVKYHHPTHKATAKEKIESLQYLLWLALRGAHPTDFPHFTHKRFNEALQWESHE